jgi:hypothetical protein
MLRSSWFFMHAAAKRVFLLMCCFGSVAVHAQPADWTAAFELIWESRWQQSGYPMSAVRWPTHEKTIKYSINKEAASSSNARRTREAIDLIAQTIEWKAVELEAGDAQVQLEITIRHYTQDELRQSICVMNPTWRNWEFSKVRVTLSEQFAYQCVLHELMHAFGFPGHPKGETVLSYFQGNQSRLKPMDVFLLSAWYSDSIKTGESPFLSLDKLTKLWIDKHVPSEQREQALDVQKKWIMQTLQSMENFANSQGEPPTILYRSGRINEAGVRIGRSNMQGMLGAAYLNGWIVEKQLAKAAKLLLLGAQNGNSGAATIIARQVNIGGVLTGEDAKPLCQWLDQSPQARELVNLGLRQAAVASETCKTLLAP